MIGGLPAERVREIVDDLERIAWGDVGTESCSNAPATIDAEHGDDWCIELRFDAQTIIIEVVENAIIRFREDQASERIRLREDVPFRGSILTTLEPSAELAVWQKEVNIVRTDKVLCHTYDATMEASLTMVISRELRDTPAELGNLQLLANLAAKHGKEYLAQTRLQTIHKIGN